MKKLLIIALLLNSFGANLALASTGIVSGASSTANLYPDALFLKASDTYIDQTDEAASSTNNDILLPDDNQTLYLGSESPIDYIYFGLGTAGSSNNSTPACSLVHCHHYELEYYNGVSNAWEELSYTDNTDNLTESGAFEFDFPEAWSDSDNTNTSVQGETLYWTRISPKSTTTIVSNAIAGEIAMRGYNINLTIKDELGESFESLDDDELSLTEGTDNTVHGFINNGDGTYSLAVETTTADVIYEYTLSYANYIENTSATGHMSSTPKNLTYTLYYPHIITVVDESGNAITPDSVEINGIGEFADPVCTISANVAYCDATPTEDGSGSELATVTVTKSGYTSKTKSLSNERDDVSDDAVRTQVVLSSSETPSEPDTPADETATVRITVTDEDGNAISGLDEDNFDVSGGSNNSIQSFSASSETYTLTLAAEESDSDYEITIEPDGYVSTSISTGTLSDGEEISNTVSLEFGFKVVVKNTSGTVINSADVKAGDDLEVGCEGLGSGVYGCAIPVNDSSTSYRVEADGYYVLYKSFSSDRDDASDASIVAYPVLRAAQEESCEVPFEDVYGHWAEGYIQELYCREVVNGRSEDAYAPNEEITRAEFLKIALLNAGLEPEGATEEDFDDVDTGDWFYEYVAYGAEEGFIEGYADGNFRPNDSINRAEALVITMRIAEVDSYDVDNDWDDFDDVDPSDWFAYAVKEAKEEDIVEGYSDDTFRPGNNITRAEIAAIAVRTYEAYYE